MLTGFLIYDWIEKPHKQEVIKEVLSLLEQKILEPNSGEAHNSHPVLITQVSQRHVHFCVSKVTFGCVSCAFMHGFRVMFVVYLELLIVTSRLPVCTYNHATGSLVIYSIRSCAGSLLWVTAMASSVCH